MEIHEVRRRQLRKLVKKRFGTQTALADATGKQQDYFSRILGGKPLDQGGKNLGEKMARQIEATLELPYMYFDDPEADPDGAVGDSLQEHLNQLPPEQRRGLEKQFKDIIELVRRPEAAPAAEPKDMEPWRLTRVRDVAAKRKRRKKK